MKKLSAISLSVLAIVLLSTNAMAWSNCKTKRCNTNCSQTQQESHIQRMAVTLDLSTEQQQKMAELRSAQQQERAQMRTELKEARQQLRASQPRTEAEIQAFKQQARTYADLKAAMLVNKIEHKQQMFSILTPEQQEKAQKLQALHSEQCQKGSCQKGSCPKDSCKNCPCYQDCCKSADKGCAQKCNNCKGCNKQDMQTPCMKKRCS